MRGLVRAFGGVAAAVGVLVLLGSALAVGLLWLTLPANRLTAHIAGLTASVNVSLDADGVPRIRANSEPDAAAALGFLHARERLFQMELMRRAASGRLSELVGSGTLNIDRLMRTLGLRQRAIADMKTLPNDTKVLLDAYARGVNAWIDLRGRLAAPEFVLLGKPEKWQPVDSLLWAKTMGLWLSMNWRQELARLALSNKLPPDRLDELWPQAEWAPSTEAAITPDVSRAASELASTLPHFPAPFTLPPTASNEWAVDGRHTATGAPLLAGDPHLSFGFPGIWFLARIETPGTVLVGATAPGIPFLVLGHNGKIAWTFTSTGADVQDIFVEARAGPNTYQTPDGPQPFVEREERIIIRGQPDQLLNVRETRHGPIISDLDKPDGPILAVAMGNLQRGDTAAAGLRALNMAATVQEAGAAAAQITSPVQNLLVADKRTIGVFTTGRVPLRKAGDGRAPVPGDGRYDWIGWALGSQLPHVIAPPSGRLVNANEPLKLPDTSVFMGRDNFGAWRSDRIREMLRKSDRLTAVDFAAIQTDVVNLFARQVLPILLDVPVNDRLGKKAVALLKEWDGAADMDLPQPLIFSAWMDAFYEAILHRTGLSSGLGAPVADFISFVLSPAGSSWCGDECNVLLRQSLDNALNTLSARFGGEPSQWNWGHAHQAIFAHPLLRAVPVLDGFATISVPTPGDDDTVDRGGHDARFQSIEGPSYRGVYDLADLDRSLFMIAPGQSGHIFSAHARDFVTRWRDGVTITVGPQAAFEQGHLDLIP